ncbi:MAG: NAD-dependent epimerase/dehydratase [Cytophagaceae bacterium]|jgi:UDP-glucose 4-epimerase|nr:NAD-dependent epimerase/dehydratase [Cytophagaceae bacterium]
MDIVTGGLGFIGNELVRQLKASGRKVAIIDNENRIAPQLDDIKDVPRYVVNITDADEIRKVFEEVKPERVFHLAAIHYIPECNAQPEHTMHVNTEGTLAVLNAAVEHHCKHFIFASTGAVYHDSPLALCEESVIAPVDVYGYSKWFAEELCRWKSSGIQVTLCRLFNNIGLRETNAHIVPEIMSQLKQGNRILKLGNTTPIRDYISTKDTASALIRLSHRVHSGCEVYNIATGKGASVNALVKEISFLLEEQITIETDTSRFRPADKEVQLADISKLKRTLNWEPEQELKEVLLELLKFEGLIHTHGA